MALLVVGCGGHDMGQRSSLDEKLAGCAYGHAHDLLVVYDGVEKNLVRHPLPPDSTAALESVGLRCPVTWNGTPNPSWRTACRQSCLSGFLTMLVWMRDACKTKEIRCQPYR
ncbi:hypothetical protein HMPREF1868_00877 [Olsenella sp. DNF00959]|nr:hypothetical protein HMPREF1868_00877 [Olsenella sp. DNF00959]